MLFGFLLKENTHPSFKEIKKALNVHGVDVVVRHGVKAKGQTWGLHQRCGCPVISYTLRSIANGLMDQST